LKKVLIVSPHWPPMNAPDLQRVRMSLPYYRANGWEPVVLAVGAAWQEGTQEQELLATVPADVRVVHCRAVPVRWSRWLGIGTLGLRALPFLFWRGCRLLRQEKFDLVFFSTTQFMALPLGRLWRLGFKVPYILDVQDPWRTDYYERPGSRRPPGGWKYQVARLLAWMFEGYSFAGASAVMSVSASYLDELGARYPWFAAKPTAVIRFGASNIDFEAAATIPAPTYRFDRSQPYVHCLYTGAAGPVMPHALTVLFVALRNYRELHPEKAARLRLHFVGTSYVRPGRGKFSVMPVAEQCGVASQVSELPHRVGHLEAIRLQQEADVLLLPGSSDLAYSPSKIYVYYLTKKPILGLVFYNSVMAQLLEELACTHLVRFPLYGPKEEAYASIHKFFDLAVAGFPAGSLPVRNEALFQRAYLADTLTRMQCELFERALAFSAPPP
jgi:hypothetical protein